MSGIFIWPARAARGLAMLGLAGMALAFGGPGAGTAQAAGFALTPLAGAQPAPCAIVPAYWVRDRYGRRIWVQPHYRRPPPRRYYRYVPPRRGWVDRYGRWHPY